MTKGGYIAVFCAPFREDSSASHTYVHWRVTGSSAVESRVWLDVRCSIVIG
jgi:hypothetical protein